jgi:lysophospholipase L1-like esterase
MAMILLRRAVLALGLVIVMITPALCSIDCLAGHPPASLPQVAAADQNIEYYNIRNASIFHRQYNSIPIGQILFLGDSHIDSFNTNDVSGKSVNLGIAGDTWAGLLRRLDEFHETNPIHRAAACVLMIGVNDTARLKDGYDTKIDAMIDEFADWATGKWVIILIPYVNEQSSGCVGLNAKIRVINEYMSAKFTLRKGFAIVSLNPVLAPKGELLPGMTIDGIHLSRLGYDKSVPLIRAGLSALHVAY